MRSVEMVYSEARCRRTPVDVLLWASTHTQRRPASAAASWTIGARASLCSAAPAAARARAGCTPSGILSGWVPSANQWRYVHAH